jgi:hypothetical protein
MVANRGMLIDAFTDEAAAIKMASFALSKKRFLHTNTRSSILTESASISAPRIVILVVPEMLHAMSVTLQLTDYLELTDSFACFRPVAEVSLEDAIELVDDAIRYCRDNGIGALLVDVRELTGFRSPSVTDRFWFASRWAETANGKVVLAMVQRPDMTTSDKIGVTFATNRGLLVDVFADEAEAIKWLKASSR